MKSNLRLAAVIVLAIVLMLAACSLQNEETEPLFKSSLTPEEMQQEDQGDEVAPVGDGTTSWDAFLIPLLDALTQTPPDYTTLQSKMSSEFWIYEPFAAMNYSPADAVAQFGNSFLPANSKVTYDLEIDPISRATFPLSTDMGEYVYTTGWFDGSMMGALLISSTPNGYEWSGVYIGPDKPQTAGPIRIEFEPGAVSATVMGGLPPNGIDEYVLYAFEGQTMTVTITSPGDNVLLEIYGLTDGTPLVRIAGDATSWSGVLPRTQDYSIKAVSYEAVPSYQLDIEILP